MTKIRLQDNSTEEDDNPGASEHYSGILPISSSIANDPDYDFNPGSLPPVSPDFYGKEVSSETKADHLWSYPSVSSERQHVSEMVEFSHPWTNTLHKTPISLVPKNMFGRSVEAVLQSPEVLDPEFQPLTSPAPCCSNHSRHSSIIIADRRQSGHHPSPSLDAGVEEVRRHFGEGLHLTSNHRSATEPINPTPFPMPESRDPPTAAHSSTDLTEAMNQGVVEDPFTARVPPFAPACPIEGSKFLSEQCPSPPEGIGLANHSRNRAPALAIASPNSKKSVEEQPEDSATLNEALRQLSSPLSFGDQDSSSSDQQEPLKPPRRPSKKSDKGKPRKYRCPEQWCDATFTRSNDVERHRRNAAAHRRADKDMSTCCRKCGEELSRPDARRRHELKDSCGKRKINRKPPHPLASG